MEKRQLARYPLLLAAFATIIQNIHAGLVNNEPVHIGIERYDFVCDYPKLAGAPFSWWSDQIAAYSVLECSAAISSAWFWLESDQKTALFADGTYFYNSRSGSFEIEVISEGEFIQIIAEFDGRTPGFIPRLFVDFPGGAYPNRDELKSELASTAMMDDRAFIDGLCPIRYDVIEID